MATAGWGSFVRQCLGAFLLGQGLHEIGGLNRTSGESMRSSMEGNGEVHLALTPRVRPYVRGDVVTFVSPIREGRLVTKRIIGMPGDTVVVNETEHALNRAACTTSVIHVPAGYLWMEGDNTSNSMDSRHYGLVPQALILSVLPNVPNPSKSQDRK